MALFQWEWHDHHKMMIFVGSGNEVAAETADITLVKSNKRQRIGYKIIMKCIKT